MARSRANTIINGDSHMKEVRDNRPASRFEIDAEGSIAFAAYLREDGTIIFTHTEVPDALAGQGIGSRLVKGALDAAREEGARVVPACSFVRHYLEGHPEYRDLL
jgi:predicted GNAT family acetyltransferase